MFWAILLTLTIFYGGFEQHAIIADQFFESLTEKTIISKLMSNIIYKYWIIQEINE